jgi:hypothetical protein
MTNKQTGPPTAEGKKRSSLNAMKHGLTANSPQAFDKLVGELCGDFNAILERTQNHYRPQDPIEEELVARIARCLWRLSMTSAMEQRMLDRNPDMNRPGASYERIMRFERLVDIHLHRAMATLAGKRAAENKNNSQNEMKNGLF